MDKAAKLECGSASHSAFPQQLPSQDHMFLRGIEAHGRHGVFEAERREGQRFIVDVDWWLYRPAATDDMRDTVCYKAIFDIVVALIVGEPWRLIETLAARIATKLLESFPAIAALNVTVHKPDAPIGGRFADVGVSLFRRRSDA